jgi:hypothetical protein
MRRRFLTIGISFSLLVCAICLGQTTRTRPNTKTTPQAPVNAPHAEWAEFWDQMIGIDAEGFRNAGLHSLTPEQATRLFNLIYNGRPSLICDKFYPQKEKDELNYLHLHVSGPDQASEFVGRLRGKLGAIRDVKLVPSDEDADMIIGILAFADEVGARQVGYIASANVLLPCTYTVPNGLGKSTDTFRRLSGHFLQTNPSEDELAATIANQLDAQSFDDIRNQHKNLLKFYNNLKN